MCEYGAWHPHRIHLTSILRDTTILVTFLIGIRRAARSAHVHGAIHEAHLEAEGGRRDQLGGIDAHINTVAGPRSLASAICSDPRSMLIHFH